MASDKNTQLTDIFTYNTKNMGFEEPYVGDIPDEKNPSNPNKLKYRKVGIFTLNPDGSHGDLVVESCDDLFSFGFKENMYGGRDLSICLHDRKGPTPEQKKWIEKFGEIIDKCKEHVIKNKQELGKPKLVPEDVRNLNPIYYKSDPATGEPVPNTSPTLTIKFMESKKNNKILSKVYGPDGTEINPLEYTGKYLNVKCAIKIESIFVGGTKISMQLKLYEADVKPIESAQKPLMKRRGRLQSSTTVRMVGDGNVVDSDAPEEERKDKPVTRTTSSGSLDDDDEKTATPAVEPPKAPKRIVKRTVPAKPTK